MIWFLAALRLLQGLLVRGVFSPDEYWQSLEVAHRVVFGYGYLTWEWWDAYRLRSIVHPGIFVCLYQALQLLGLDSPWAVAYLPRLVQALALTIVDAAVYYTALHLGGTRLARNALALSLCSWFAGYAGVRTYSNSTEMCLAAVGMWLLVKGKMTAWNVMVGLSCMMRPTAVLNWLGTYILLLLNRRYSELLRTLVVG